MTTHSAASSYHRRSTSFRTPSRVAIKAGTMSLISRIISTWHSGSPNRTLYSRSFGHASAGGQPVGFDDGRHALFGDIGLRRGGIAKPAIGGGRNALAGAQIL